MKIFFPRNLNFSLFGVRPRSAVSLALTTVDTHILVKGNSSSFNLRPVASACFLPSSVRIFSSSAASMLYWPCRMRRRCRVAVGAAGVAADSPSSSPSLGSPRTAFGFSRPSQSSIHFDFSRGNCRFRAYCLSLIFSFIKIRKELKIRIAPRPDPIWHFRCNESRENKQKVIRGLRAARALLLSRRVIIMFTLEFGRCSSHASKTDMDQVHQ